MLRVSLATFILWNLVEVITFRGTYEPTPDPPRQKIFIASTHWNNEVAIRSYWNWALLDLVKYFGVEDVYVSIYESGSWDDSKGALRVLDKELDRLGVRRTIILDPTTHADEIAKPPTASGWIDTPRGKKELRRISYLSGLRNLSLRPLEKLEEVGVLFDKLLFLNDVVFTVSLHLEVFAVKTTYASQTEDVIKLLDTNNGQYAAACAMDYSKPPNYYDTFALRDADGEETVMQTWPYFRSRTSRSAIKSNKPVPVTSCWNGMGKIRSPSLSNLSSLSNLFTLTLDVSSPTSL